MALIQLYQFLLSIKLSFRVMSLSAAVGIRDPGEESIRKPSLIILTINPQDLVFYLPWTRLNGTLLNSLYKCKLKSIIFLWGGSAARFQRGRKSSTIVASFLFLPVEGARDLNAALPHW